MEKEASIDYILEHFVGGAGRFQVFVILFSAFVYHAGLYPLFLYIFAAYIPAHRCRVPICESDNQTSVDANIFGPEWLSFAIPSEGSSSNFLASKNAYDGCRRFKQLDVPAVPGIIGAEKPGYLCSPQSFSNETESCDDYIYDNSYFDETLSTRLNLVCGQESQKNLLGTILILGLLVGSALGGRLGDRVGRKKAMFLAVFVIVPSTIIAGHVPHYAGYAILHFITATCLPIIWLNDTVYMNEFFRPGHRFVTMSVGVPFGMSVFSLIVYLNRTWTSIHIWVGIMSSLILPAYFILPESPRWLAQNFKEEEAVKVLLRMGKMNGKDIDAVTEEKITEIVKVIASESHQTEDKLTPLDMFRKGHTLKSLNLCLAWITTCVSFYALSLNATALSGHIVLNFFLSRMANIGAVITTLTTINYFGRIKVLVASHTILGACCIALAFMSKNDTKAILAIYIIANIAAATSFSLVFMVTAELYPTNLRSQAMGCASMIARIFCLCAPFLGPLAKYWTPLPMLIIGIPILVSAGLALKLPETHMAELPQTMQKAQELREIGHRKV